MNRIGPCLIALCVLGLCRITWLHAADAIVDYGREVYVPWRLSEGDVLYRDLAYFNGPLTPYLHAALFRIIGPSIRALAALDVAILLAIVALTYRLLVAFASRFAATVACLLMLPMFAFEDLLGRGNYNYLAPYSHEATHGLLLGLLGIAWLTRYGIRMRTGPLVGSGLCLGLSLLTKPEVFVALGIALAGGLGILAARDRSLAARMLVTFSAAAVAPVAAAALALAPALGLAGAISGIGGSWVAIFTRHLSDTYYYRYALGTIDPRGTVRLFLAWGGGEVLILILLVAAGLAVRRPAFATPCAFLAAALTAGVVGAIAPLLDWRYALRPLPLYLAALAASWIARARRGGWQEPRALLHAMLILFSGGLLLKILLAARVWHYGFTLAMPATMLVLVALLEGLPRAVSRRGGSGCAVRAGALGALAVVGAVHLHAIRDGTAARGYRLGSGADRLWVSREGPLLRSALDEIDLRLGPQETLLVLPEGALLNYLSRRPNPTPYFNFMPPEIAIFGEDRMLAALEARPPDYVALVSRDTEVSYGVRFGVEYGQKLLSFVTDRYEEVALIGERPEIPKRFGILLLHRRGRLPLPLLGRLRARGAARRLDRPAARSTPGVYLRIY